jgi:hypothetical protein
MPEQNPPMDTPLPHPRADGSPHVLAFYLPQFHQVPENDAWHGSGFTEWSVVARSKPLYPGHRQPDLPGELGFCDLRVPETRYRQARLAQEHGITGFLYYHYWFGGRRMLGRPFDEVRASGQPDFPFALCWANESWYRRWQGSIDEMLLEQVYSEQDDVAHIRWLIECFRDPRYIRIEGRPLLAVYRAHFLPDARRTVAVWRAECERAGMEPPWLVMFETEEELSDPAARDFDASAEFIPHHLTALVPTKPLPFGPDRSHRMFEYEDVAQAYLGRPGVAWQRYPCVATGWDNSPRRQAGEALILHNSTPEGYGRWLAEAARRQAASAGSSGVVFVNAWNEWAEGAHLEPDQHWGRAYLEVTREVLQAIPGARVPAPAPEPATHPQPVATEDLYHDLYQQFVLLQQSASGFLAYADRRIDELKKLYDAKMAWATHKGELITDLNDWLYEQLRLQEERMEELDVGDIRVTEWLREPGRLFGVAADEEEISDGAPAATPAPHHRADGEDEEPPPSWRLDAEDGAGQVSVTDLLGDEADERPPLPVRDEEDERRRDDGIDDLPPRHGPVPRWLLERDSSG